MKRKLLLLMLLTAILAVAVACSSLDALTGKTVKVGILYGSEKQQWLAPLVKQYNDEGHKTASGSRIVIEATAMGSIESVNAILKGESQPVVWSPASDLYLPVASAEWRKQNNGDLYTGTPKELVLSPVVIAMWKPMAEALGWPSKPLGWADIAGLATSDKGWEASGYPEWGKFKLGHTHPDYSNSGFASIVAEAYAGAGKQRGLSINDLNKPEVLDFMTKVESSIIHYGSSTGFFADEMFQRGPSYLSAAVMYENLIVEQESKRIGGQSNQLPVVAIYPKEGTFWSNHPYVILNATWVTAEQKEAAGDFQTFLLDKTQQQKALELGFRPADPSIALGAPLDADHGVDPSQPKTVLEVPPADVLSAASQTWRTIKKPVDLVIVVDISGSMEGDKIASARQSLVNFINLLDDRDQLEVMVFNSEITTMSDLSPLGEKRSDVLRRVSGIIEGGNTRLYDAVSQGYDDLKAKGNPNHIRALVVLSDGADTASELDLPTLSQKIGNLQEGGNATKVFTIAFGSDAEQDVLKKIAEISGAKMYAGDPKTIEQVYAEIAKFF